MSTKLEAAIGDPEDRSSEPFYVKAALRRNATPPPKYIPVQGGELRAELQPIRLVRTLTVITDERNAQTRIPAGETAALQFWGNGKVMVTCGSQTAWVTAHTLHGKVAWL